MCLKIKAFVQNERFSAERGTVLKAYAACMAKNRNEVMLEISRFVQNLFFKHALVREGGKVASFSMANGILLFGDTPYSGTTKMEIYAEGVYDGDWVHGKRQGSGRMKYFDETCYTGQWYHGKKNGIGVLKRGQKTLFNGVWKDDKETKVQL